jgi:probable phosphoglycerate mutase
MVRHGTTDANIRRQLLGADDPGLNDDGIIEGRWLADYFQEMGVSDVVSSPSRRCVETATAIGEACNLQVRIDPALRERDLGSYDGLGVDEVVRRRRALGHFFVDPTQDWSGESDVESDAVVAQRVTAMLEPIRAVGKDVCLVTHAGVIKSMFHTLFAVAPDRRAVLKARNASILVFHLRDDGWNFEGMLSPRLWRG